MSRRRVTALATMLAAVGWAALALQLYLLVTLSMSNGVGVPVGVVRYFSYFTILTNIIVALVLSASWLPAAASRWFSRPGVRAATAAYIAMVGIVYGLLLRDVWNPQGLQKLADIVLHDVMPLLYVGFWLMFWRAGTTSWNVVPSWLIYPLVYLAYALVHGAIAGWYPYHFIDAGVLGYPQAFVNAAMITVAFSVLCLVVIAIDRTRPDLGRPEGRPLRTSS
jgi:hypothetical protein